MPYFFNDHDAVMPHSGIVMKRIPLLRCFRQAFVDEREYKLVELKADMVVLEIHDSLTMQIRVSNHKAVEDAINKLRGLQKCQKDRQDVMVAMLSGPSWTEERVQMVQCVVEIHDGCSHFYF